MIYSIISLACLVFLALELVYVVLNIAFRERAESINFIRSFKKGKCAIIFIIAVPLYTAGHMYAGRDFLDAFFTGINKIINLVVLKYDTSTISALMNDVAIYKWAVYVCFFMVGANALLFTFSLVAQHIWAAWHTLLASFSPHGILYLFGNNPQNILIYESEHKRRKLVVDNLSDDDTADLYRKNVLYADVASLEGQLSHIVYTVRHLGKECVVVINTGSDEENIRLSRHLVDEINGAEADQKGIVSRARALLFRRVENRSGSDSDQKEKMLFSKLKVFVFGDPKYEGIYLDIVASGYGCISYVNKYQKVAVDFIDRYPLASFMTDKQFDIATSTVRDGVDINVILLGFGKTNQQIFLSSVANNQFITFDRHGEVKIKQVEYFIFDRDNAENNKNLNHTYYRFESEFSDIDPDDYLAMPDQPAHERYLRLDINSSDFYSSIKDIVLEKPNDANFIVIAFGSDLENIDMAQKLLEKRHEWQLDDLVIFVKARGWHKTDTLLEQDNCFFIGNEADAVYSIEHIVGDKLDEMAHLRNEVHFLECDIAANPSLTVDEEYLSANKQRAEMSWYTALAQYQRESSLYACLALRSKLNLMGLDYCPLDTEGVRFLSEDEYMEIYALDDKPISAGYPKAEGKTIVAYPLDPKHSRRYSLAYHDHLRWNAYMITKGFVPSTVKQILEETYVDREGVSHYTDGKSYELRRHGNLTTFDGLIEYRRLVAERDGVNEAEKDKIRNDFNLLDDAHWILTKCGFGIYKRQLNK